MRKKIFAAIEPAAGGGKANTIYSTVMMVVITASLIPLAFKESTPALHALDLITTGVFVLDYLLRLLTADLKLKRGAGSFFLYPITPMAIIDLLAILPTFLSISGGLRLLKVIRLVRTFKVFRALKFVRYSKNIIIICNVIRRQKEALITVGALAIGYILVSALVVFNVEPDTFGNFFDAVYWATVSLTTVGYGDIYPVTTLGRLIAMVSSLVGIAIVALPAGIITAGYMDEIGKDDQE